MVVPAAHRSVPRSLSDSWRHLVLHSQEGVCHSGRIQGFGFIIFICDNSISVRNVKPKKHLIFPGQEETWKLLCSQTPEVPVVASCLQFSVISQFISFRVHTIRQRKGLLKADNYCLCVRQHEGGSNKANNVSHFILTLSRWTQNPSR